VTYENAVRSLKAVASEMVEHKEDPSFQQLDDWHRMTEAAARYIESVADEVHLARVNSRIERAESRGSNFIGDFVDVGSTTGRAMSAPKLYWAVACNGLEDGGTYICDPWPRTESDALAYFNDEHDQAVAGFRTEQQAEAFSAEMQANIE
jgi:hypothetical protein